MTEAICGAVILVGLGLLSIFARDMLWELTHWSNSIKGVASERTENWDIWSVISGVILIVIGGGLVLVVVGSNAQEQRENEEATATMNSRFAAMESTYLPIIPTLRADAAFEPQEVSGGRFGLPASQKLTYGLCEDEDFFLYIRSGSSYRADAFVEQTDPDDCEPDGWAIYHVDRVGENSADGAWYDVDVVYMPTYELPTFLAPVETSTPSPASRTATPAPTQKGQQGP